MLSTAVIDVFDSKGWRLSCGVLLDSGSQASFISQDCSNKLRLKCRSLEISVVGINQTSSTLHHMVHVNLKSRVNSFTAKIKCIVTDQIIDSVPSFSINPKGIVWPPRLKLADPNFHVSAGIDILIGVELFWELICVGQIKGNDMHPTLQKTHFG